ncbi:hypothetical protein JTE90_022882 [Oedothorax gibbosus]|uniref:Rad21/Rec8-like protein C-terminal eukaryotic domain-containing protein n=1 Tax=Oedothorax gibbosus TaxID=931172 RepID=A0AAV6UR23_9ARAC|nr:hypothetical protein JTE90_022882 [Oedothorax gibbosus]
MCADGGTGVLFEPGGLFDDAPLGVEPDNQAAEPAPVDAHQIQEKPIEPHAAEEDSDDDMYDMGPGCSMGAPSPPSSPESPAVPQNEETPLDIARPGPSSEQPEDYHRLDHSPSDPVSDTPLDMAPPPIPEEMPPPAPVQPMAALDHTTLINNDAESFALAPLDAMIVHGSERPLKAKRKRKLVVDEVKSISGEEMKSQLSDTTDIVATLDLAPPTKRLMHWKETGGVEKLFSLPGHRILSKTLTRSYLRHLTTRSVENEGYGEEEVEDPRDDMSMSKKWKPNDESHPHDDLTHLDSFKLDPSSFTPSLPHHVSIDSVNPSLPHHSFTHHVSIESVNTSHPSMDSSFNELNHIVINDANSIPSSEAWHSITPSIQSSVEPLHHMQQQMMPPPEFMHHHEPAPLLPPAEHQTPRPINGQDDEATQPLMDQQYPQEPIQMIQQQQQPQPIELPVEPPMAQSQNGMEPPPEQEVPTNIFDSLIGDMPQHMVQQQPQTSNTLNDAEMDMIRNNEFVPSDDDDFDAPASVGPIMPEEQMADETYEQFEERILTKRTTHLLHVINDALDTSGSVSFQHMVRNNKRKQVAQKFYTFLVLKKQQAVELEQNPSYGDLIITKGPKYDTVYNSN